MFFKLFHPLYLLFENVDRVCVVRLRNVVLRTNQVLSIRKVYLLFENTESVRVGCFRIESCGTIS